MHLVEAAFEEAVDEHLDRTDQALERGMVAVIGDLRHDLAAHAVDEAEALVADRAVLGLDALRQPFLVLVQHEAQHVGVEAAAQALVGGNDHDADALHGLAPREQRVLVFRVGARRVHRDVEQALGVRATAPHALLRLLHLRGSDHFHRLRDLARVLHALDLEADFLGSGHVFLLPVRRGTNGAQYAPFFLKSSIAATSAFSSSAFMSFVDSMRSNRSLYLLFTWLRSATSNARARFTSTSSK